MNSALAWQSAPATNPAQKDRTARETRVLLEDCLRQGEELDYLTAKVAALTKLDAQGKELVAALDAQIAAQERTITALKAANAAGDKVETISEKELKSFQDSLTAAEKEAAKWKGRASFWRKVAGFGVVTAVIVGAAVGYVLGSK